MRAHRAVRTAGVAIAALTVLAGCAGSRTPAVRSDAGSASATSSATASGGPADPLHPVGVVAIGHSGMTGYQSDPEHAGEDVLANSWATGTNVAVQSIASRLVAVLPETAGQVANLARDGATADLMPDQVQDALRLVPAPRLALVQVMDNDIRCDGTDADHLVEFRESVRTAVEALVAASPRVTVVIVGGAGRPAGYAKAISALPTTPVDLVGDEPCAMFSANRVVNPREVVRLTALVEAYEAELARACEGIPQCHTDSGRAGRVIDRVEDYGVDLGHQSVSGHAHTAEAVWPAVAAAMGLN